METFLGNQSIATFKGDRYIVRELYIEPMSMKVAVRNNQNIIYIVVN